MREGLYIWATRSGAQGTARIADLGPAWVPVAGDGRYGAVLFRREDMMDLDEHEYDDEPELPPDYYYCPCCGDSAGRECQCPMCGVVMRGEWF